MKGGPVRVGIIGSQFQADCHAAAIGMIERRYVCCRRGFTHGCTRAGSRRSLQDSACLQRLQTVGE